MKSRSYRNQLAKNYLKKHRLYSGIVELTKKSGVTGCSLVDYVYLHHFIRKTKPQYFLECGTGVSTYVIAEAMNKYCYQFYGGDIKLISMEHDKEWHDKAVESFPGNEFTEIKLSETFNYGILFVTGRGYKEIPSYPYDVVFVDGPDGDFACIDYLKLLLNSAKPISAIIDGRLLTVLAFQAMLGKRVTYFGDFHLVKPTSKLDILTMAKDGTWNMTPHLKDLVEDNDGIPLDLGVNWNV